MLNAVSYESEWHSGTDPNALRERSDAGLLTLQEVFGIIRNLIRSEAEEGDRTRGWGTGQRRQAHAPFSNVAGS
jgi:hypothetical protein